MLIKITKKLCYFESSFFSITNWRLSVQLSHNFLSLRWTGICFMKTIIEKLLNLYLESSQTGISHFSGGSIAASSSLVTLKAFRSFCTLLSKLSGLAANEFKGRCASHTLLALSACVAASTWLTLQPWHNSGRKMSLLHMVCLRYVLCSCHWDSSKR